MIMNGQLRWVERLEWTMGRKEWTYNRWARHRIGGHGRLDTFSWNTRVTPVGRGFYFDDGPHWANCQKAILYALCPVEVYLVVSWIVECVAMIDVIRCKRKYMRGREKHCSSGWDDLNGLGNSTGIKWSRPRARRVKYSSQIEELYDTEESKIHSTWNHWGLVRKTKTNEVHYIQRSGLSGLYKFGFSSEAYPVFEQTSCLSDMLITTLIANVREWGYQW